MYRPTLLFCLISFCTDIKSLKVWGIPQLKHKTAVRFVVEQFVFFEPFTPFYIMSILQHLCPGEMDSFQTEV